MIGIALPKLEWGTVDGVQALWIDAGYPFAAGVTFRVGRADEPLPLAGITHLVAHLALENLDRERVHESSALEPLFTTIVATGEEEGASDFLQHVLRDVARLNAGRLGTEAKVVQQEVADEALDLERLLLGRRYGASGIGRALAPDLASRLADPFQVARWASSQLTRRNAAFWFRGVPPRWLEMPLTEGALSPQPASEPVPWLHLPGTGTFDGDGFALSMVVPASPAGDFAVHALDLRVRQLVRHGVCEAAEVRVQPVSLQQDHVSLLISCDRAHVPNLGSWLIDQVELLGREALALIEFREWLASFEDRVRDPGGSIAMVQREAERLLMGGQPQDFETQLEERRQVHPSEPAVVLRDALGSLLMLVPDTIGWHDPRLPLLPDASGLVVHGRRLSARGAEPPGSAWTIGVDGISWLPGRGMVARTVHYATCEAMLIEPAGARTLVDRDGTSLHIDPADWKDADTIVKLLDSSISHDRWGHVEAATGA